MTVTVKYYPILGQFLLDIFGYISDHMILLCRLATMCYCEQEINIKHDLSMILSDKMLNISVYGELSVNRFYIMTNKISCISLPSQFKIPYYR